MGSGIRYSLQIYDGSSPSSPIAKKWQEYQAEQEAIRIAEEKRQAGIAKADAKVERCQTIRDRIAAQLAEAERNLMTAQIEREALDDEGEEVA